jgi:hypothetical protein
LFSGLAYQAISDEIRASMPMPNFGSLMLPDSDPRVKDALHKLEEKAMTEVEVKDSLVHGLSWPQSHAKHQEARKQMCEKLMVQAGLDLTELSFVSG